MLSRYESTFQQSLRRPRLQNFQQKRLLLSICFSVILCTTRRFACDANKSFLTVAHLKVASGTVKKGVNLKVRVSADVGTYDCVSGESSVVWVLSWAFCRGGGGLSWSFCSGAVGSFYRWGCIGHWTHEAMRLLIASTEINQFSHSNLLPCLSNKLTDWLEMTRWHCPVNSHAVQFRLQSPGLLLLYCLLFSIVHCTLGHINGQMVKSLYEKLISELRSVTCRMRLHGVTCHPTQVNAPAITSAKQAGTKVTYPRGTEGWVDLGVG